MLRLLPEQLGTFELTSAQITELLSRNPYLGELITNAEVYGTTDLSQGYSFNDSVYGNVLISTDANGLLHVIGNSPVNPNVINQGPYQPPPQPPNPCTESIGGFFGCLKEYSMIAIIGIVGILYFTRK